jgi:2-oxo-4-hydroxy-4-carboxy--5-ureidoimidazoline (OHCU) decarboxylase
VRELPGKLSVDELAELFEGRTRLVERLAAREHPLQSARALIAELDEDEKLEALNAHPAIGARTLSPRSAAEQGSGADDDDPETLAELARLNRAYEERFGFRFVVFVNRRPKRELVPILRQRLRRSREQELDTAVEELVAIAEDRWRRSQ